MDWLWWGTVVVTLVGIRFGWGYFMRGLAARRHGFGDDPFHFSMLAGVWIALTLVFLLPSGLFFVFYAWDRGGNAEFAAAFPQTEAYWREFIPASFNPEVRAVFAQYFPAALPWLTALGAITGGLALRKLLWLPWRSLRDLMRPEGLPLVTRVTLRYMALYHLKTLFYSAGFGLFFTLCLQTLLYLLGHALATVFFLIPFLLALLVLALFGGGGRDIYDRNGRRIGRLDD